MPLDIRVDDARQLVVVRFQDAVTPDDLARYARRLDAPDFPADHDRLTLFQPGVRVEVGPEDLVRFAMAVDLAGARRTAPGPAKSALVGEAVEREALIQVWPTFHEDARDRRVDARLFGDLDAALAWLERDGPIDPDALPRLGAREA